LSIRIIEFEGFRVTHPPASAQNQHMMKNDESQLKHAFESFE